MIALQIVETVVLGSCDEIIARGSSYYDAFTIFPDGGKTSCTISSLVSRSEIKRLVYMQRAG